VLWVCHGSVIDEHFECVYSARQRDVGNVRHDVGNVVDKLLLLYLPHNSRILPLETQKLSGSDAVKRPSPTKNQLIQTSNHK